MKNIEIKVEAKSFQDIVTILINMKATPKEKLSQIDTYYLIKNSIRLKTREINKKNLELIYYKRANNQKSKKSSYDIMPYEYKNKQNLKNILKKIFGVKVIVRKERQLWIYKNTRIHLDQVKNLGKYIELETVIKNISPKKAMEEHLSIINKLELNKLKKVAHSYSDLMLKH